MVETGKGEQEWRTQHIERAEAGHAGTEQTEQVLQRRDRGDRDDAGDRQFRCEFCGETARVQRSVAALGVTGRHPA